MIKEHDNLFPELFFYAALSSSKVADYAWDGGTGLLYAGSSTITNGEFVSPGTAAANRLTWNSYVPTGKNLTFSAFMSLTGKLGGVNCGFCGVNIAATRYSSFYLCFHGSNSYKFYITAEWLTLGTTDYIPVIGVKNFYTVSVIFNGSSSYTFKFYVNGNLIKTQTLTNLNWLAMQNLRFGIGYEAGGQNVLYGKVSKCSCYELLTDEQVLELYNNGGNPL